MTSDDDVTCPNCGATGKHIADVHIPGVYDGPLYHGCFACDHVFHRRWATAGVQVMMEARAAPHMLHGFRRIVGRDDLPQPSDPPHVE
jgi:hypothetical protein